jgi:hypothetical protein
MGTTYAEVTIRSTSNGEFPVEHKVALESAALKVNTVTQKLEKLEVRRLK